MELFRKTNAAVKDAIRAATRSRSAFELKGVMTPLTVLRLRSKDLNMIERQLRAKVTEMPQFFEGAPVVIDLSELEGNLRDLPLAALAQGLRVCRVIPVGAINVREEHEEAVRAAGLGILQTPLRPREESDEPVVEARAETPPEPVAAATPETPPPAPRFDPHRPPMVIRQAVRSGQEVYARKNDLIVLAPVNPGAQIYADGHIHVYAPLRGRAMAGAQGMREARIYCQKLEAELVAVAGAYVMADDLPQTLRGKAAQVFLEHGECRVGALGY